MERVRVLKDDAVEDKQGERARMASFAGAIAIADLIKTTLGPKGMDKLLQGTGRGRNVTVTNDGVTILKSPQNDNPGAEVPGEADTTGLNVEAKKKKRRGKKSKKNKKNGL